MMKKGIVELERSTGPLIEIMSRSEYDTIVKFILSVLMESRAGRVTLDQLLEKAGMTLIRSCPRNTYFLLLRVKKDMVARRQVRIHIDREKVQHIWLSERTRKALEVPVTDHATTLG